MPAPVDQGVRCRWVIVVGLSIGTFFTLFVLPAIIVVFVETFGMRLADELPAE